jgi:trk system potassium uptake protein TrkH
LPSRDLAILCRNIGDLLIVLGGVLLSVIIVPLIFKEYSMIPGCLIPASASLLLGLCLKYLFKTEDVLETRHAMTIAALGWLVAPLLCAIPFMLDANMPFLDAYFESMSGWTGTGLSMIAHPSELSHTLQFLRSFMQWLGGVGVIVLMISIITRPGTCMYALYHAEGRDEKTTPRIRDTIRTIWRVYLALTAAGVGLLWLAGMPLWDAINCAMTGIGTGGFTVTDGSIAEYHSTTIEIALILIMLVGAIPFLVHYRVITRRMSSYLGDIQCRAILAMVLIGSIALLLENMVSMKNENLMVCLVDSVFQFVSS